MILANLKEKGKMPMREKTNRRMVLAVLVLLVAAFVFSCGTAVEKPVGRWQTEISDEDLGTVLLVYRFTEEELALYKGRGLGFEKCLSTSGVRLKFVTDSEHLYVKILNTASALDTYFSLEIHVNGNRFASIDNFNSVDIAVWPVVSEILGEFEK